MGFSVKNDFFPNKNNEETEHKKILDFLSSFKQSIEKEQQEKQHEAKEVISNLVDTGMVIALNSLMVIASGEDFPPDTRIQASALLSQLYQIKISRCD